MNNNPEEMVTKKEFHLAVAKLATKDELKAAVAKLATKDELKAAVAKLATKDELQALRKEMFTKDDHARFVKGLQIWQKHIEGDIAAIREEMYTKRDHARDMVWMDKAMTEIEAAREERLLYGRQVLRIDDKVFDHEKRIGALEKSA